MSSIKVNNLTKGTSLILNGSDQLNLTATVGLPDFTVGLKGELMVHPNPVSTSCMIEFSTTDPAQATIELFDLAGKQVFYKSEFLHSGQHAFNLSGLEKGSYLLKILSDKYSYSSKILSINDAPGQIEFKSGSSNPPTATINKTSRKSNGSIVQMEYNDGDIILAEGTAETEPYITYVIIDPIHVSSVVFEFISSMDGDGNIYPVVKIASSWWMARNLKTTKYNDNISIPKVVNDDAWAAQTVPAYCWYNNDSIQYSNPYGAMYNWYTVNTGKLCPVGWHVPNDNDWNAMLNYIGGESVAGGLLKESGYTHWNSPNEGATNATGFGAVGGGFRGLGSRYMGILGSYWSSNERNETIANLFVFENTNSRLIDEPTDKANGWSVRCIKD